MNISSRFDRFIAHIRPSRKQLEEADRQVAVLRERLTESIAAGQSYHLEKIFRSGSSARHTDLVRRGKGTFDIDPGLYYRAQGQPEQRLDGLLRYTHGLLRKMYQEKAEQDICQGKNAVHVTFRTSKLQVDVVPIIRDHRLKRRNSGWIPREDGRRLTSITAHVH